MTIVRLGEFIFTRSEVPDFIPFSGSQAIAVHQLVGGKRVVDAMGVLEPDISWSGTFIGTGMVDKARYLDQLMRDANVLTFSYNQFRYTVLIKQFLPKYRDSYIDYSITLQVVENLTKPIVFLPQLTWVQAFQDQLLNAQTLAALIQNGTLTDQIGAITALVDSIPDMNLIGQEQTTQLIGLINNALGTTVGLQSSLSNSLFG